MLPLLWQPEKIRFCCPALTTVSFGLHSRASIYQAAFGTCLRGAGWMMLPLADLLKGSSRLRCSVNSWWRWQGRAGQILVGRQEWVAEPRPVQKGQACLLFPPGEERWDVQGGPLVFSADVPFISPSSAGSSSLTSLLCLWFRHYTRQWSDITLYIRLWVHWVLILQRDWKQLCTSHLKEELSGVMLSGLLFVKISCRQSGFTFSVWSGVYCLNVLR